MVCKLQSIFWQELSSLNYLGREKKNAMFGTCTSREESRSNLEESKSNHEHPDPTFAPSSESYFSSYLNMSTTFPSREVSHEPKDQRYHSSLLYHNLSLLANKVSVLESFLH